MSQIRLYDDGVTPLTRWAARAVDGRSPILDIGCGRGFLAETLPASVIHGVEMDPERAAEARERYAHVYESDIDRLLDEKGLKLRYEAAVCIDSLEHLNNPQVTLNHLRSALSKNSILAVAIPNIAHISMRWRLLKGDWRYADMGMLDRTHLHFFTFHTAIELVEEGGFEIVSVESREKFPRLLAPCSGALRGRWPNLFGYHTMIVAQPKSVD